MGRTRVVFGDRDIATEVRRLFGGAQGDRIVITAFIGRNPTRFLGDPTGIEVYCWPHPVATHPQGLRELLGRAALYFVKNLHMKVFQSERGAIVGSANLSGSALDEGGLSEAVVVFDDARDVPITKIKNTFLKDADFVDEGLLRKFELDFERSRPKRVPKALRTKQTPQLSYQLWRALPHPAPWVLAITEIDRSLHLTAHGRSELAKHIGEPEASVLKPFDYVTTDSTGLHRHDWVLCARSTATDRVTSLSWLNVDYVVMNDGRATFPYLALQMSRRNIADAPFNAKDDELRSAIFELPQSGQIEASRYYRSTNGSFLRKIDSKLQLDPERQRNWRSAAGGSKKSDQSSHQGAINFTLGHAALPGAPEVDGDPSRGQ